MSDNPRELKEIESIKDEFRKETKDALLKALEDNGIKMSPRAKKEVLLETIAHFIVDSRNEAEKSTSDEKNDSDGKTARKNTKSRSQAKTGAKSRGSKRKNVPEITKERRSNVKGLLKSMGDAQSSDDARAKAYGEDQVLKPRRVKNAPEYLTIDGTAPEQKNYEREEDFTLTESFQNPSVILSGELHMVFEPKSHWVRKRNPKTGDLETCYESAAVVKYGSRLVYIPAEFFFLNYWGMDKTRTREYLEERQLANVYFRVINVNREDPKNPVYIGSRIAAMEKLRCDYWYSDRDTGKKLLTPNTIQQARVAAVFERSLFVEMYGAEIQISEKNITYNPRDLRNLYSPGDLVDLMVESVTLQDAKRAAALGYPVEAQLSIKKAKPDPRDKYFVSDLKNMKFKGILRSKEIDKNNITWYRVEMGSGSNDPYVDEGLTIYCRLAENVDADHIPMIGDIVEGKMTYSNDHQKKVYGTIYHVGKNIRSIRR